MAERKAKTILGPLATDPDDWPPLQRETAEHQAALERLLDTELTECWKEIFQSDGMNDREREQIGAAADRRHALNRAEQGDMDALQQFIASAIAPDGRPVGKKIAGRFVNERTRKAQERRSPDHLHNVQLDPAKNKKTEAVWEARRAKAILVRVYGRTPDGYSLRTDLVVSAKRSGLDTQVIQEWEANHSCPEDPWAIHHPEDMAKRRRRKRAVSTKR